LVKASISLSLSITKDVKCASQKQKQIGYKEYSSISPIKAI